MCTAAIAALGMAATSAAAKATFEIPAQPLPQALAQFGNQSGFEIIADSTLTAEKASRGVHGAADPNAALKQILSGTGLSYRRSDDQYLIVAAATPRPAPAGAPPSGLETVVVTAERKREDIQSVPIAVSAFTQKELKERQ